VVNDDRRDELSESPDRVEDDFLRELLGALHADRPEPPDALADRTIRKVQAELTGRDLIDLTTFVFLMRFCAPILDLLAAFFGHDPLAPPADRSGSRPNHRRDRDE
jgi:hypothetical protein